MSKKILDNLAKEYGFEFASEYFDHIVKTWENGQPDHCLELYKAMRKDDREYFLLDYPHQKDEAMLRAIIISEINK